MPASLRDVSWAICSKFNIPHEIIVGPHRARKIARPRQIAMYLCREEAGASWPKIGRYFNRDHTTAIYAHTHIGKLLRTNPKIAGYVDECRRVLASCDARRAQDRHYAELLVAGHVSWLRGHEPVLAQI